MVRPLFAFLLLAGTAGPAAASSPDPKTLAVSPEDLSKARELVQLLASEQFADREKAEDQLEQMGRLARPALVEAVNTDPSQEVRARCSSLLPRATALDIKARVEVFLADADGKFEHDLPGWGQFRSTVRNEWRLLGHEVWSDKSLDKPARAAFADLIATSANRAVVMAASLTPGELGQVVAARRQELYNQKFPRAVVVGGVLVQPTQARRDPTPEDVAALLFAESHSQSKFVPRTAAISTLVTASGFARALQSTDDRAKVYRTVAESWLETRTDPMDVYYAMTIANTLAMPDHRLRLAARLFADKGAAVSYRGIAANTLAQAKDTSVLPLMAKALGDSTVMTTVRRSVVKDGKVEQVGYDVQIRDVALAVSLVATGQNLEDYGFIDQHRAIGAAGGTYSYTRFELPDAQRKAAFEKWKEWQEKEKGKK